MSATPDQPRPDGSHPAGPPKKGRPGWLVPLIAALVVLALLLLLLSQCGDDEEEEVAGGAAPDVAATEVDEASPSPSMTMSPEPTATTPATPATPTSPSTPEGPALPQAGPDDVLVTAGGVAVLPLVLAGSDAALPAVVGEPVTADGVVVQAVVTDKGFWVGPSADQRVFVRFVIDGESEVDITDGQTVDFDGVVVEAPNGLVQEMGLTEAEGAPLLEEQGAYIQVEPSDLEVVAPA